MILDIFPSLSREGKSLNLRHFPSKECQGKSLKMQAFSLGKQGKKQGIFLSLGRGKKPEIQGIFPREKAIYPSGIIFRFPRFARVVTGERKGGYAVAAYPSLPLSVTKKAISLKAKKWQAVSP